MVSGPSGFMHRPTYLSVHVLLYGEYAPLYSVFNCASWYSPPTTIVKYSPQREEGSQRKTERKEQSWHSLSLSLSFHGPLSNRQPIRLESRRGKLRRFLREKRIGRRAIDCIYANTFLCVKINIFMHVILHVIVSYHLSFGFEIYYLHTYERIYSVGRG